MKNVLKCNDSCRIWVLQNLETEIEKRGSNNSTHVQNSFAESNQVTLIEFEETLKNSQKDFWIVQNALKSNE